ncbi:FHA domain-containing protein [Colwellia sp. Arc7-635]|uniref:FHA domain-containing protein n=1 Tax=Colwellia sp. Arc7-635 TaxID=2497879 RepID=UPI000F8504EA|nr:FHA domain-containing protein [Colwellia sp. Arc7-635]AZQ82931.1 FHA domain-containing protein [Colwellia sp. Arc7-635]
MEIIIEELSHGHKLLSRQKFASNNITIGRGYDNDIIISDPHVCADHLQLHFNGEDWLVDDQGSVNGSYLENSKDNVIQHKVRSGDIITIGKSQVRFVFPSHPVSESIAISTFENLINIARHPIALTLSMVFFALIAGWIINLNNANEVTLTQMLVPTIGLTLGFALWPAGIALVSHLTKHDARFWTQMGISFIFFNLMWLSDIFENIVHFNTSSNFSMLWTLTIIPLILAFCLFWLNCYVGFHMTLRRRNVVASCLVVLLFGGSFVIQMSKQPEFNPRPQFDTTIMSPAFLFTPSSDVESFVNDSAKLFEKVAKEAAEDDKE